MIFLGVSGRAAVGAAAMFPPFIEGTIFFLAGVAFLLFGGLAGSSWGFQSLTFMNRNSVIEQIKDPNEFTFGSEPSSIICWLGREEMSKMRRDTVNGSRVVARRDSAGVCRYASIVVILSSACWADAATSSGSRNMDPVTGIR